MNFIKKHSYWFYVILILIFFPACNEEKRDNITIDLSVEKAAVPESLYGIFFEEITHSGDGGLYAEMIQNRGFEDGVLPSGTTCKDEKAQAAALHCYSNDSINHFNVEWNDSLFMNGWEVVCKDGSVGESEIVTDSPLNQATPHSICIHAGKCASEVRLINSGYWGIAVEKGKKYNYRLYIRTDNQPGEFAEIAIVDKQYNRVGRQDLKLIRDGKWNEYTGTIVAAETGNDFRFMITFPNKGKLYVDFVSLFPEDTYKGRKNGLRNDVATMLADLKPNFIRWPGGCIVEGLTMENRVKWKETIGDIVNRPGEYNLWGYRSTYGFGYHEFLQFCEDIDAYGMFVCNAGMSCLFRNGDYYSNAGQIDDLIREALDAIEYAIGDNTTFWGKKRAENGHPEPFPLRYVEVGNENIGICYAENYKLFYSAIKEKYPQIEVICALMFSPAIEKAGKVDIIDPHYYETAGWFYRNADLYDKLPQDIPYKIYVGEYAAIGRSSLYSSLAEAAYLTGVERNSDQVQLVSYAPLIENAAHGKDHLLVLKNDSVYGRTNYYVLKMFSENRPAVNVKSEYNPVVPPTVFRPEGYVGLGTDHSTAEFKDFRITRGGKEVYKTTWHDFPKNWDFVNGDWTVENGVLKQTNASGETMLRLNGSSYGDCTIEVKTRKISGASGFRIIFGGKDSKDYFKPCNYFMADIGSHRNESIIFREINEEEGSVSLFDYRNDKNIQNNLWYDVKVVIEGNNWKCYLNGELQYEYTYLKNPRQYYVCGYDKKKEELIIKLVNSEEKTWNLQININNALQIGQTGEKIELAGSDKDEENSFATPEKIVPVRSTFSNIDQSFMMECKPNSFTVLRIPCKK